VDDRNTALPGYHVRLEATPKASSELRRSLRSWLTNVGASDEDAFDVTLACCEAFANAVGRPTGRAPSTVEIEAVVDPRRLLTVVIRDHVCSRGERGLDETRAFLRLMEALMESAETYARDDGVTLVLRKRLRYAYPQALAAGA
jgi:anti-sigma regulatory factor (Ser/Thr protein kinase)